MASEKKVRTGFHEVLFYLASEDRLALLAELSTKKRRLKDLSRVINASPQECSRHLSRLSEAGMIEKDSDGLFGMTDLGRAIVRLFPSTRFLLSNGDYFLSHDLTFLPKGFLERIGELSGAEYVHHFSSVLELIKKVISSGEEHVWLISDQPMVVGPTIGPTFFSTDVPVRLIGLPDIDKRVVAQMRSSLPKSEIVYLPEVKIAMAMNESMAGVCFPDSYGGIDFAAGFAGADPIFREWCHDLFEFYWSRARRVAP
ncbi:MAG TPA: helix-turn-helix domain-containing protein [Nitrososphaerales archaeon]|nr:helix-turn-helix domain-containing protein [Nitrososphaerales archaeon]